MYFLDLDLYKLVNQAAILQHFSDAEAQWKYTNRQPEFLLTKTAFAALKSQIEALRHVVITNEELDFLHQECPYFSEQYLEYLSAFRYRTDCLSITFKPRTVSGDNPPTEAVGELEINAQGKWCETTLFEGPILQIISEAFHRSLSPQEPDYSNQETIAYGKASLCIRSGVRFAEFGSRRRRSLYGQELILRGLQRAQSEFGALEGAGCFMGSSNVHLCRTLGLHPLATMSHEWFMGVGAIVDDYSLASKKALSLWIDSYGRWFGRDDMFGLALPDTFGSKLFLDCFGDEYVTEDENSNFNRTPLQNVYTGLRLDSGDPYEFIQDAQELYSTRGHGSTEHKKQDSHTTPCLMFSDSMNPDLCVQYNKIAREAGFRACFAMSSNLTNDFPDKHGNPNIVFKLHIVNGKNAVKLSDAPGKALGAAETLERVTQLTVGRIISS